MTWRQIMMFYRAAVRRENRQRAERISDIHFGVSDHKQAEKKIKALLGQQA